MVKTTWISLLILLLALVLRFYNLAGVPPGLNIDEASQGYDAYSLYLTGKDRYGQSWPIALRSFGTYILPLETYLLVPVVGSLGLNVFSVRIVPALLGTFLVLITLFFVKRLTKDHNLALISAFLVAVSPWAVVYSRSGLGAMLGSVLFILGVLFLVVALKRPKFFIFFPLFLGLSSYAYYSERYLGLIFYPLALLLFRKTLFKNWKMILLGTMLLLLFLLPQFLSFNSQVSGRRVAQVSYWSYQDFREKGKAFENLPLGWVYFVIWEFSSRYVSYFSPANLFYNGDPQSFRAIPNVSVFYFILIGPFILGLKQLFKRFSQPFYQTLILLIILSPIPAALAGEPFYTMRILTFLWAITLVISIGVKETLKYFPQKYLQAVLSFGFAGWMLVTLYLNYFILFKYERSDSFGYEYLQLAEKIKDYPHSQFVIDAGREVGAFIWLPTYLNYLPQQFQNQVSPEIKNNYYNNIEPDLTLQTGNLTIRAIVWRTDIYKSQILVGDPLSISAQQAKEHNLSPLFEIKNLAGEVKLKAYQTNPK